MLNVLQMKLGIDAAKKAGGVVEAVVCYSGDVASKDETKYTLEYYIDFVDQIVEEGIHVLGIKDMAGLLKPQAAKLYVTSSFRLSMLNVSLAYRLIGSIRAKYPDLPIHVHSHDTAGISAASMIAAAAAGADVVDVAIDSELFAISLSTKALCALFRHVWPDFSAAHGCCDLGPRADRSWHWNSLR